jgi:predicted RNase H-like HicB family nuclease
MPEHIDSTKSLNICIALQRSVRLQAIIWKEEDMFVIKEAFTGVTTQGKTIEEAMENLKEAIELYLEEKPEIAAEIKNIETVGALNVEIAKAAR